MPMTENDARSVLPTVATTTTTATTLASAAADVPATEEINLFGKYELGKLLGFGASGKVYQAMDVHTGQSVAVKAVSKQRVLKGGLTGHVKREISIMHRLRHPHIVRLHEVLATRSKVYFVMDFAKGGELFDKVSKGRFSEALSRRYFHQLISAVDYCHSKGIFHRDLKLENLLLDEEWNLKLTDFGLSAVTDQVRHDGRLHTLCGTPAYVAPEILSKKGYDGVKVDIWSCGIVLYIMNAGYLPFNDPNLVVMYKKIYKGEFRCPKWTSPDLKRLLNRLLDRNPETRITVDEILKHPWFKEGYNEIPCSQLFDEFEELRDCAHAETNKYLNAFDLISFSSGIDLSGLLGLHGVSVEGERFVSAELPERIIKTVEEVGKAEGLKITKKKIFQVRLERQNGSFTCVIWIHRLTDKLVLVDVRRRETATITDYEIWNEKLKAQLDRLIYRPDGTLALSNK